MVTRMGCDSVLACDRWLAIGKVQALENALWACDGQLTTVSTYISNGRTRWTGNREVNRRGRQRDKRATRDAR